jgi:hypothetical protein
LKRYLAFTLFFAAVSLQACTIFVLTDTNRVLFCNNEDATSPMTRIWFVPAGEGRRYGRVAPTPKVATINPNNARRFITTLLKPQPIADAQAFPA